MYISTCFQVKSTIMDQEALYPHVHFANGVLDQPQKDSSSVEVSDY